MGMNQTDEPDNVPFRQKVCPVQAKFGEIMRFIKNKATNLSAAKGPLAFKNSP